MLRGVLAGAVLGLVVGASILIVAALSLEARRERAAAPLPPVPAAPTRLDVAAHSMPPVVHPVAAGPTTSRPLSAATVLARLPEPVVAPPLPARGAPPDRPDPVPPRPAIAAPALDRPDAPPPPDADTPPAVPLPTVSAARAVAPAGLPAPVVTRPAPAQPIAATGPSGARAAPLETSPANLPRVAFVAMEGGAGAGPPPWLHLPGPPDVAVYDRLAGTDDLTARLTAIAERARRDGAVVVAVGDNAALRSALSDWIEAGRAVAIGPDDAAGIWERRRKTAP